MPIPKAVHVVGKLGLAGVSAAVANQLALLIPDAVGENLLNTLRFSATGAALGGGLLWAVVDEYPPPRAVIILLILGMITLLGVGPYAINQLIMGEPGAEKVPWLTGWVIVTFASLGMLIEAAGIAIAPEPEGG